MPSARSIIHGPRRIELESNGNHQESKVLTSFWQVAIKKWSEQTLQTEQAASDVACEAVRSAVTCLTWKGFLFLRSLLVTTSKALVTRSDALVPSSFLLLLVRHLLLSDALVTSVALVSNSFLFLIAGGMDTAGWRTVRSKKCAWWNMVP